MKSEQLSIGTKKQNKTERAPWKRHSAPFMKAQSCYGRVFVALYRKKKSRLLDAALFLVFRRQFGSLTHHSLSHHVVFLYSINGNRKKLHQFFSTSNSDNQSINRHFNQTINQSNNQSINQSINPWVNQSINQSINQWVNQSINQWTYQSSNPSIKQSINQAINQWVNESMSQWVNQSINQWVNQSINQWVNQSIYPWVNQSINGYLRLLLIIQMFHQFISLLNNLHELQHQHLLSPSVCLRSLPIWKIRNLLFNLFNLFQLNRYD